MRVQDKSIKVSLLSKPDCNSVKCYLIERVADF